MYSRFLDEYISGQSAEWPQVTHIQNKVLQNESQHLQNEGGWSHLKALCSTKKLV